MNRLEFSQNMGCLINVTKDQTRMIVGMCIGIKLFCGYVLYRPWLLNMSKTDFRKNFEEINDFIDEYASVFYYLIMDEMSSIPPIMLEDSQLDTLAKFKLKPMDKINIYPEGQKQRYDP